jgi:putative ABC transport system substrate-binding protein
MNRRIFLLGCGAVVVTNASVQSSPLRRIGFISSSTTSTSSPLLVAFRESLAVRGYEEGKTISIEYKFAQHREQLTKSARELVNGGVEAIVAAGSEAIVAAREATKTIPIVMANSGDAVRVGFADSRSRPGGNVTGMTQLSPELAGKRLEMLREIFPGMSRVGVLWNPDHPNTPLTFQEAKEAGAKLRLEVLSLKVSGAEQIDAALNEAQRREIRGFMVLRDPFTVRNRAAIISGLHRRSMLAIFETGDFIESGGLMSFGADFVELFREAASYVDKILKGASPAELPIQQPTKFTLAINLRVARERGIVLPQALLVRADQLTE